VEAHSVIGCAWFFLQGASASELFLIVGGVICIMSALVGLETGIAIRPGRIVKRSEDESLYWSSLRLSVVVGVISILVGLFELVRHIFRL
jgi:hypothetical protein